MAFGGFLNPVIPKEAKPVAQGTLVGTALGVPGVGTAAGVAQATVPRPPGAPGVPGLEDAAASAAERLRQRRLAAAMFGRASTLLTGGRGLLTGANIGRSLLLGG